MGRGGTATVEAVRPRTKACGAYDYGSDPIARRCLELASESKAKTGFGAVLVKSGRAISAARNRRSAPGENDLLGGGVDYAIHAEQAAILSAIEAGVDPDGLDLYVIGRVQRGPDKGALSVRPSDTDHAFTCVRCARTMKRFRVSVHIPLPSGWYRLGPEEALQGALEFRAQGRKRAFMPA